MSPREHLSDEDLGEALTRTQQRHIDQCPGCTRRRSAILAVQEAVRALPRTAQPPASTLALLDAPDRATPVSTQRRWWFAAAAALAVIASAAIARQRLARRAPMGDALVQEIALDHLHYERNSTAAEVTGSVESIESYFAATLHRRPNVAPLEATELVGGKRCRIGGEWSALVWLERAGHWLSLFSMSQDVVASRGCARASGITVCGIPDPRGGSRVLAGKLPDAEMLRLLDESME